MSVNYQEQQHHIENSNSYKYKFLRWFYMFLGWFCLILGVFGLVNNIKSIANWNSKKDNYFKEYVYSDFGTLYYEANGEKVYIQNIYNTDNEQIKLKIPNNKIIVMYINKENINDGIYLDLNNLFDHSLFKPTLGILMPIALFTFCSLGFFLILSVKEAKEHKSTTTPLYPFSVCIFLVGIGLVVSQLYNTINFFNLKSQNNITTATICSEIYNKRGTKINNYKPVAYYYVNGEKYIYINDNYEEWMLNDKLGDTFELYYDESNPNKMARKDHPVNLIFLVLGIAIVVSFFPLVFLKSRMDKRLQNKLLQQSNNEWKI